jgi:hypothetical protein
MAFWSKIRCAAVEEWLHHAPLKSYPNSAYAKQALGPAWRPTDDH